MPRVSCTVCVACRCMHMLRAGGLVRRRSTSAAAQHRRHPGAVRCALGAPSSAARQCQRQRRCSFLKRRCAQRRSRRQFRRGVLKAWSHAVTKWSRTCAVMQLSLCKHFHMYSSEPSALDVLHSLRFFCCACAAAALYAKLLLCASCHAARRWEPLCVQDAHTAP